MFALVVALIPGFPLLAALANGINSLVGERYSWRIIQRVTSGSIFLSFMGSLWVLAQILADPTPREVVLYRWLVSGHLAIEHRGNRHLRLLHGCVQPEGTTPPDQNA